MKLGDFGKARDEVEATFGYFGAELRVNPNLSDLTIVDLFSVMQDDDENGEAVLEAFANIIGSVVHPDDVKEFTRLARENRQTMEDITELAMQLIGALAERPTRLPSDSSDGQSSTEASSMDDSSSRALRLLEGRPDLQVAVLRADAAAG